MPAADPIPHLPLVRYLAREYVGRHPAAARQFDDLVGAGTVALIVAAKRVAGSDRDPKAYLSAAIRRGIRREATARAGLTVNTLKRRLAEGVELPQAVELEDFHLLYDDRHESVSDLLDSIHHACRDDVDRAIVSAKRDGATDAEAGAAVKLSSAAVKARLTRIWGRLKWT